MSWVRFEKRPLRFHLVLVETLGGFFTYCGRFHRAGVQVQQSEAPPAQCRCCVSRQRRPYLVPEKLLQLKERTAEAC